MSEREVAKAAKPASLQTRHHKVLVELERYRLLVESIQDYAIFLMDEHGYIQTWNQGAERFKGYKPDDIIGKHFSIFYRDSDVQAGKPERELELAEQFGRVEDEDWRVRKDGTEFWANVVITALHDATGKLVGFAKVTRDLTERKQHEDDLRRANIQLRRQQQDLQRLSLSKDEFISLASHQLRTPATSIKQYLGMLLEGFMGELPPELRTCIERAYESNEHQLSVVNSLLKVAQIDAGKVTLRKSPTNIRKLAAGVLTDYNESFRARKQQAHLAVPASLEAALDVGHFRMVLENLIDNASKYTRDGGTVTVIAKKLKNRLHITIQDSGVGIAPEEIGRLFGKFTRIPNALSDAVGGSGLGLYWVRKVVELHGGTIDVQSEVNKGTTFTIGLPTE